MYNLGVIVTIITAVILGQFIIYGLTILLEIVCKIIKKIYDVCK